MHGGKGEDGAFLHLLWKSLLVAVGDGWGTGHVLWGMGMFEDVDAAGGASAAKIMCERIRSIR